MAQNFNFYAIIGNNGYGLSSDWSDIASQAKFLQNEWHKGFQSEEEAYNWLVEQVGMRSRLNACGICDLDTLRSQRLVTIDSVQRPAQETTYHKPAEIKKMDNIDDLDKALDELTKRKPLKKKLSKKNRKNALVEQFEQWLDTLDEE